MLHPKILLFLSTAVSPFWRRRPPAPPCITRPSGGRVCGRGEYAALAPHAAYAADHACQWAVHLCPSMRTARGWVLRAGSTWFGDVRSLTPSCIGWV